MKTQIFSYSRTAQLACENVRLKKDLRYAMQEARAQGAKLQAMQRALSRTFAVMPERVASITKADLLRTYRKKLSAKEIILNSNKRK